MVLVTADRGGRRFDPPRLQESIAQLLTDVNVTAASGGASGIPDGCVAARSSASGRCPGGAAARPAHVERGTLSQAADSESLQMGKLGRRRRLSRVNAPVA